MFETMKVSKNLCLLLSVFVVSGCTPNYTDQVKQEIANLKRSGNMVIEDLSSGKLNLHRKPDEFLELKELNEICEGYYQSEVHDIFREMLHVAIIADIAGIAKRKVVGDFELLLGQDGLTDLSGIISSDLHYFAFPSEYTLTEINKLQDRAKGKKESLLQRIADEGIVAHVTKEKAQIAIDCSQYLMVLGFLGFDNVVSRRVRSLKSAISAKNIQRIESQFL